jgi:outer membrane biosynthesis protein TonB
VTFFRTRAVWRARHDPPELLSVVQAEPTEMATLMKIQGSVDIDFVVGTDGTVIGRG